MLNYLAYRFMCFSGNFDVKIEDILRDYFAENPSRSQDGHEQIMGIYRYMTVENPIEYVHMNRGQYAYYIEMLFLLKKYCQQRSHYDIMVILRDLHAFYNLMSRGIRENVLAIIFKYFCFSDGPYTMIESYDRKMKRKIYYWNNPGSGEHAKRSYRKFVQFCKEQMSGLDREEKIDFLKFAADVLKRDIKYSYLESAMIGHLDKSLLGNLIPLAGRDENGNEMFDFSSNSTVQKTISINPGKVLSLLYCDKKIAPAIKDISEIGYKNTGNTVADYYKNLDFAIVTGGYHHASAAAFIDGGIDIRVMEIDDTEILEKLSTDGANWYYENRKVMCRIGGKNKIFKINKNDDLVEYTLDDFRIALLFHATQELHKILNRKTNEQK